MKRANKCRSGICYYIMEFKFFEEYEKPIKLIIGFYIKLIYIQLGI